MDTLAVLDLCEPNTVTSVGYGQSYGIPRCMIFLPLSCLWAACYTMDRLIQDLPKIESVGAEFERVLRGFAQKTLKAVDAGQLSLF